MPYALFSNDAKLSKAYPTAADVWKIAQKSGLVVDVVSEDDKEHPHPVLDHDSCGPACNTNDPHRIIALSRLPAGSAGTFDIVLKASGT